MDKFSKLLAKAPGALGPWGFEDKTAQSSSADNPDEYQFETDFAKLAYMFLQDRAQQLMKYLLGFEIVSKNEDGSRAVGLFGFKVSGEYYFVPAFFLNNQVKGMDMLFSKKTNMFQPLQEDTINTIVNRHTIELGGPAEDEMSKSPDFSRPDFSGLIEPPVGPNSQFKFAGCPAAVPGEWDKYAQAFRTVSGSILDSLNNDPSFQQDWASIVYRMGGKTFPVTKTAAGSLLLDYIAKVGGPRARETFFDKLGHDIDYANAALSFYPDVPSMWVTDEAFGGKFEKKAAQIRIVTMLSGANGLCCGNDEDETKKRVVRDGFAIVDDRPEEFKSESFDVDYEKRFSSPDTNGRYNVLLRSGKAADAYVLTVTTTGTRLILDSKLNATTLAKQKAVYTRDDAKETDGLASLLKKGTKPESMEAGGNYVLVGEDGTCLPPFTVRSVMTGDDTRTSISVSYQGTYDVVTGVDPDVGGSYRFDSDAVSDSDFNTKIEVSDTSKRITIPANGSRLPIVVPAAWKAIKLPDDIFDRYSDAGSMIRDAFMPGTPTDAVLSLEKAAFHKLTVACDDGLEYYFRLDKGATTRPLLYKSAFVSLVAGLGLRVDDAEAMLKEAVTNYKSRRLVRTIKSAQMGGVAMGQPMEQAPSVDPYTGVPVYNMEDSQMVDGQTAQQQMPDPNDPARGVGGDMVGVGGQGEELDPKATSLANEAASVGQRNVFDLATVGGLAKTYDVGVVIDSYMPEFSQAVDKLGRILFLFYWKGDEFGERYGSDAMVEIEDTLRSVFKGFGELITLLRQKSIMADDAASIEM